MGFESKILSFFGGVNHDVAAKFESFKHAFAPHVSSVVATLEHAGVKVAEDGAHTLLNWGVGAVSAAEKTALDQLKADPNAPHMGPFAKLHEAAAFFMHDVEKELIPGFGPELKSIGLNEAVTVVQLALQAVKAYPEIVALVAAVA